MNKLSILLLGALGLMAASCDDAPEAPKPQENPQEPILTAGDITSATDGALSSAEVLSLEDYRIASGIPVMKLTEAKSLPEGAAVEYKVELAAKEDFSGKVITLTTKAGEDGVYTADPYQWNDAHVALFGKSPKVKKAYYRVPVYVNLDGSNYRYESESYYAATGSVEETCMDQGFVIESEYFLIGNLNDWKLDKAIAFTHSDADVYDDPVFVATFKVTQEVLDASGGGCYWKIAPLSAVDTQNWDAVYGPEVDGDASLTGMLVEKGQAGKITLAGNYKMTINMESLEYTIEKLARPEYLYTPGGANGWNQENSAWMQYDNKNEKSKGYYGLFPVTDAGFKISLEKKWDNATDYGAETEDPADEGTFVLGGAAKNIHPAAPGMYWMSVQYDDEQGILTTYKMTPITRVGVIGSFAASGWGSDVAMTANEDMTVWTAEVELAKDNEWKVRFNNGWDISLGGEKDNMGHAILDGDNYKVEEDGTYVITLTLQPGVPTITCVKK